MSKTEEIFSVGIDIGTTTTSLVLSKLTIKNVASGFVVPKIEIVDKTVIYRSDVHFTPLVDDTTIDFGGIEQIVRGEYERARVNPEEIKTGAVIITGDTARKENAESVLSAISRMAGSFVVATAGPHLEAYIAGLGSGAAAFSAKNHALVANADIGGGTTNISVFDDGKLVATMCADIGGRLIRFESRTGRVTGYISGGEVTAGHCNINLARGQSLSLPEIRQISDALAGSLVSILKGRPDALARKLAIGPLPENIQPEYLLFSGGVGRLIYDDEDCDDIKNLTRFGDLGPALAQSVRQAMAKEAFKLFKPDETIYATVIGAGVHTTELSGSTIYISDSSVLPFRDLPAINLTATEDLAEVTDEIVTKAEKFSHENDSPLPAIVVPKTFGNSFKELQALAFAIAKAARQVLQKGPLVVICEDDIGKAIGNLLKNALTQPRPIIAIDQLSMKEGDYIDIGRPLYDGGVVPVVIKTLVFSNS